MWLALVVAVVLVGLTVAAVLGRIDGSLVEPTTSLSYVPLPDEPLTAEDVRQLRLDTGLRGYRMDQVDEVIDRLSAELTQLRNDLAAVSEVEARVPHVDVVPTPEPPSVAEPQSAPEPLPAASLDAGMPSPSPFTRPPDNAEG
ncbi:MAG: DivIVA domain-containing protein [Actinomycetales bacterium]|jgi:DivIVA domain-containing protein|nr:DivIVA domain-containing protein [Candidatus Phosphoribacter baldrii]MBK6955633.1 DivIVA domain-containing protein [Candidatus Phosphoribacter baldrii]